MSTNLPHSESSNSKLIQSELPTLGVGLGFREPFKCDLFLHQDSVDFLEITAEHYFDPTYEKQQELELLKQHFTLIPHGLNLSLGSADGINEAHLKRLAELIQFVDPPWWSEHLSFTEAHGIAIGHLSPLPFTDEAVEIVCRNIKHVRKFIDVPLILENITYTVSIAGATMSEAEFVQRVLEKSNCGLLLDVTNVYANSVNHQFSATEYLQQLPLDRVVQLHFVGGMWQNEIYIDNHSSKTSPEIWELMKWILEHAPVKGAILERDGKFPRFEELTTELEQARELGRKFQRWD